MKVLIIINSAFQMISGTQVVLNYFSNDKVDVLITDRLADYSLLCEKFRETEIYENVYSMNTKNRIWKNWQHTVLGFYYDTLIKKAFAQIDNGYDICLFANISGVSTCLATYLHKKYKTKLYMYEDGFASYSDYYMRLFHEAYSNSGLADLLFYGREKRAIRYVSKYFVFNPELISDWNYNFDIVFIPKIDSDSEVIKILNKVFDYDQLADDYQKKVVFFEESYFADGIEIGDIELIKQIADIVGTENIIVKIHPRNTINRFSDAGYITNVNTSVPWEIIALNQNFSNTMLMTISSGSSITSYFISKKKADKSILLYEMDGIDRSKLTPSLVVFDKICKNDSYFVYPHTLDELKNILLEKKEQI